MKGTGLVQFEFGHAELSRIGLTQIELGQVGNMSSSIVARFLCFVAASQVYDSMLEIKSHHGRLADCCCWAFLIVSSVRWLRCYVCFCSAYRYSVSCLSRVPVAVRREGGVFGGRVVVVEFYRRREWSGVTG